MTTGFQKWRTLFIEQHHGIEPSAADAWNATQPPQDERTHGRIPFAGHDPKFCPGSNPDNPQTEEDAQPAQPVALSTLAFARAILATSAPAQQAGQGEYRQSLIDWVVGRWHEEVANRPMVNVHRRALDDTWRKILRHLSVDDRERLGPTHDELRGNSLMQDKARDLARAALSGTGSDESAKDKNRG